jgi:putative tryptophan/tyrosine transport system substrate-binding protein
MRASQFAGAGQLGAIQAMAPFFGMEVTPIDVRNVGEMERAIIDFSREPNCGLIVLASFFADINRGAIIALAAQQRLPTVYPGHNSVRDGGLISYMPGVVDQYRLAAGYVDRILKGEKPADLPVQAPTKYSTALNLKTARALGLSAPETPLARVDEVIQ